jgi:hypothetical protein
MTRRLHAAPVAAVLAAAGLGAAAAPAGADFTIRTTITVARDHRLTPPVIALPNHTHLRLTVHDATRRPHTLSVRGQSILVSRGRDVHLDLRGLTTGRYPVSVDGHVRGHLTVGAAGGP